MQWAVYILQESHAIREMIKIYDWYRRVSQTARV